MFTKHNAMLLLICGLFSGCTAIDSITASYSNFSLNPNRQYAIPSLADTDLVIRPDWIRDEAIATPLGSLVNVVTNDGHRVIGILANRDGEGLELAHCIFREIVPAPDEEKQCQSSYLPSQSISFRSLRHFSDLTHITPSPKEFRRKAVHRDDRNSAMTSIVLKNGRQMQIPNRSSLEHEMRTEEEICEDLSQTPAGSEICVLEESGRCLNAIVLEIGTENIKLMNCITQEVVSDSSGRPQTTTTHIPFETLKVRAIRSFRVIAPLPPNVGLPKGDIDCNACVVEAFVARNGNRYCWGKTYSVNDHR
jgi:hypothetical protein